MHKDTMADFKFDVREIKQHDEEAERQAAAGLMNGVRSEIVLLATQLEEDDFFFPGFQALLRIVKHELDMGDETEVLEHSIMIRTKYRETLCKYDWLGYGYAKLSDIGNSLLPSDKPSRFLPIIKQKTEMRRLLRQLYTAIDIINHEQDDNTKAYAYLQDIAFSRLAESNRDTGTVSKEDFGEAMLMELFDNIDPEKQKNGRINTNWPKFQNVTGGFALGDLVIISAPSGKGKSALSLNIAVNAGVIQKQPTLYINSEMQIAQMAGRVDSYLAYVDSSKLANGGYAKNGELPEIVCERIQSAADRYHKGEMLFKQAPDIQIGTVEAMIRMDKAERGTKLVVVDYIGRMDFEKSASKDLQEWQVLRLAAMRLKRIALEQKVCIIMVAQLTERGTLQGSTAMKNEADLWVNLNRPSEDEELDAMWPYNCEFQIRKARGVQDNVVLRFRYDGCLMRFSDTPVAIKEAIDMNRALGEYANEIMTKAEYDRLCDIVKTNELAVRPSAKLDVPF